MLVKLISKKSIYLRSPCSSWSSPINSSSNGGVIEPSIQTASLWLDLSLNHPARPLLSAVRTHKAWEGFIIRRGGPSMSKIKPPEEDPSAQGSPPKVILPRKFPLGGPPPSFGWIPEYTSIAPKEKVERRESVTRIDWSVWMLGLIMIFLQAGLGSTMR